MNEEFKRTVCACQDCISLCKRQPGPLDNKDFEKIVSYIRVKNGWDWLDALNWVKSRLWRSPGALVLKVGRGLVNIGSITPRFENGRCVFLNRHDRCDIHPVSPYGCRMFDSHMSKRESMPRQIALVESQEDESYQALRKQLPKATSYNPFY